MVSTILSKMGPGLFSPRVRGLRSRLGVDRWQCDDDAAVPIAETLLWRRRVRDLCPCSRRREGCASLRPNNRELSLSVICLASELSCL